MIGGIMSPSLENLFDYLYPPTERDGLADLEDMSYSSQTLKPGVKFGLIELGGQVVQIQHVEPDSNSHTVKLPDGHMLEFGNDEDVYEPPNT